MLASAIFFLATFTRFVVSYTSVIWRNRSWRAGLAGLLRQPRTAWSDEVVVITGGAQGLGAVLAETLAMLHATVVVLDINESLPAFGAYSCLPSRERSTDIRCRQQGTCTSSAATCPSRKSLQKLSRLSEKRCGSCERAL